MKKPTANCKHARFEIDHKWHYSQEEVDEGVGCWACGGVLVPSGRKPFTELDQFGMDDKLRAECEADPQRAKEVLAFMNRPEYTCPPCEHKRLQGFKQDRFLEKGIPIEDLIEELRGRKGRLKYHRETLERIREVEACVPDCPYRERLPQWYKKLEDVNQKIEGFDDD